MLPEPSFSRADWRSGAAPITRDMTKRQPKGTPVGGQFAEDRKPDGADLVRLPDGREFPSDYEDELRGETAAHERSEPNEHSMPSALAGDVSNVQVGSRTPWGTADYVNHIAPGIVSVATPGHGGVKLSPERNKKVPVPLRTKSGWYEEDCEAYIPMMIHAGDMKRTGESTEDAFKRSELGVMNWFPEGYEEAFNEELPLGASLMKDEKTWLTTHALDEIAISAIGTGDGMVKVTVCVGGRAKYGHNGVSEREILVPKEEYDSPNFRHPIGKHSGSFVVDSRQNYEDVTPPPKAPNPPAPRYREINLGLVTNAQRERAQRDLDKRYRFSNGSVQSVREVIESGGIASKSSMENNGRRTYYLRRAIEAEGEPGQDTFNALEVSKALWDAVVAPAN